MHRRAFLIAAPLLVLASAPTAAETTRARQAVLVEHPGGRVLFAKAADKSMAPSSMTKLMTLYLAFAALEEKKVAETTAVKISKRAAKARGSTIGLEAGDSVPFGELVRATAIASANDAAVALAEHLARSEAAFAKTMTATARGLGLEDSRFANATGHTAKNHRMTAADVAKLAGLIIQRYPERYRIFAEREFKFRGQAHPNRNPLLGTFAGADGIKTGQTTAGGYGIAASAARDGKRLILVINGLDSEAARADEAKRLLDWGFRKLSP
jgi:D-alanyl-D-alanine carboxypeptidase (penicillin-binding protein 5/6)